MGRADKARLGLDDIVHLRRRRRVHAAYQALFFGTDGQISANGRIVLDDLIRVSALGQMGSDMTDAQLRDVQGRRTIVLHVLNRLDRDGTRIDDISRQLREQGHG